MVEIHYHLLFGLDDGPKSLESSLELANASIAEGVTHIVCTPHANHRYPYQPVLNRERLARLDEHLGAKITLGLGCDFHLAFDNIEELRRNPSDYTINRGTYLLTELPDFAISQNTTQLLFDLVAMGVTPIITHPERNPILAANVSRMGEWIGGGCLVQITAGSLIGRFGTRAKAVAHQLIKKSWAHFIASDAHSISKRPPAMQPAYKMVKAQYGQSTADRLCIANPYSAFLGKTLSAQPQAADIRDEFELKRSFFRKFFDR